MRRFLHLALLAAFLLAATLPAPAATKSKKRTATKPDSEDNPYAQILPGGVPSVRAASVVVIDAKTGEVLYEKNAAQHRPPASTQKLLTALVLADAGNLQKPVEVEPIDTQCEPVKLGFKPGETYTRQDLLDVLLVHSTNDVARCLARDNAGGLDEFAAKMNRKAAELGATDSHFVNPNGLPAPGQYSTARDMAKIAKAAYANRVIRSIVATKTLAFRFADGHVREFKNTNRVLLHCAECNGMKTGYTEAAGRCLIASGTCAKRDVIAVVLGDTTSSIWKDAYSLLAWGLAK
jgi:serine-type D-Ala-D-Ala carboxypeptidase (penicillin-binding protein 5/6)